MSTLTQAAATFVAISAGFYTTKILTIAGDKNRLEHKLNYIKAEISYENQNIANRESERNNFLEDMENQRLNDFIHILKERANFPAFKDINTFNDFINYYKDIFAELPSSSFLIKLKTKSDSTIKELTKIKEGKLQKNTFSTSDLSIDEDSRIIELNQISEEQQNFNIKNLEKEIKEKENKVTFLNQQLSLLKEELHTLIYPKHVKFGFISFGLFAFLGVVIPLMHKWWSPYFKANSDVFAFIMFLIGLIITFVYISSEISSIFKKSNSNK
jgi:hypothetical protein